MPISVPKDSSPMDMPIGDPSPLRGDAVPPERDPPGSYLIGRTFTLTCDPPVNFTTARVVAIEHGLILIQGAGKDADRGQVWIRVSAVGQLVPVDA